MKNIPIKFRGKKVDDGEFIYGDLMQGAFTCIVTVNGEYKVDPKSVRQLVGYWGDKEIYEDDTPNGRPAKLVADF